MRCRVLLALMRWRIYVDGEVSSVARLATLLRGGGIELELGSDLPYLHGALIDAAPDPHAALQRAAEILPRLNAAGRRDSLAFKLIRLVSRVSEGDGPQIIFARAVLSAGGSLTVGGDQGPQLTAKMLAEAKTGTEYADAIELFGSSPNLGWGELYKIYELLKNAAGDHFRARTGVSDSERRAFTASANDRGISGLGARHAVARPQRARHSMGLDEARELVRRMLTTWLNSEPLCDADT
jgi:hypothetical protein